MLRSSLLILLLVLPLMTLSACGSKQAPKGTTTIAGATTLPFDHQLFSMQVPANWVKIERDDVPELRQYFLMAYASPAFDNGFSPNISVVKEDVVQIRDGEQYAKANMITASKDILDYQKLDEQPFELKNGGKPLKTVLHVFEGRYRKIDPLTLFLQVYFVKGNTGYILTANLHYTSDDTDREKYVKLFQTFTFKD